MQFQGFLHEAWVKTPVPDNNITDINEETDIRVAFFLCKRCWSVECMTWLLNVFSGSFAPCPACGRGTLQATNH